MAAVSGSFAALAELRRQVRTAASPAFATQVSQVLGATALKLLADEFKQSRNPYGVPWKPVFRNRARDRKARARRAARGLPPRADKPLIDTGRMRASAAAVQKGSGFELVITAEYASHHQDGTSRIARRQMLPVADTGGLGPIWGKSFERQAKALVRDLFKQGPT